MKFFYWNLNDKEKFIRSSWTGASALIFLYLVVGYYVDDLKTKIGVPIVLTLLYVVGLFFQYRKWKRAN
ncbi:hypothetical protein FOH38_22760 [Lysinibacillus fusiformis]|nr:hypothetical protein FOH38_22760 [Lysinibacillus fusiformis]